MKKFFVSFIVALIATCAFAQTKTLLKSADLPKKVTDYITQNMKGFTVDKAYKMENKGEMSYAVIVMKGTEKHKMHFDKDGNFIKRNVPAEEKKNESTPAQKAKESQQRQVTPGAPPAPSGERKSEPRK